MHWYLQKPTVLSNTNLLELENDMRTEMIEMLKLADQISHDTSEGDPADFDDLTAKVSQLAKCCDDTEPRQVGWKTCEQLVVQCVEAYNLEW